MESEGMSPHLWSNNLGENGGLEENSEPVPTGQGQESQAIEGISPAQEKFRTVIENFRSPSWEKLPRIKELSGMSEDEINNLPPNGFTSKSLTALLRAWQKDVRSELIQKVPDVQTTAEAKLVQLFQEVKHPDTETTKKMKEMDMIYTAGGSYRYFDRMRDDMLNPFDPEGKKIYGTEYAQLVNLAARKAQGDGILSRREVFKLTLLACIQYPPGFKKNGEEAPSKEFLLGKRDANENTYLHDSESMLTTIPLTEERIRDKEFARAVKLRDIVETTRFKESVEETVKGFRGKWKKKNTTEDN